MASRLAAEHGWLNTNTMREGVHLELVTTHRRRDATMHSGTAAENNGVRRNEFRLTSVI